MSNPIGRQAENCQPPLVNSDEVRDYLRSLKEGERIVECGQSGITGNLGTVYIGEISGAPTVCVRWDKQPGEAGQFSTSVTGGARRLKDAGTFAHLDDPEGPFYSDGCDSDGFSGGCLRAGHSPTNCPGLQVGDTVVFAEDHIAAGDTGVIVGYEVWLNATDAVVWDGVGGRPAYKDDRYPGLGDGPPRYLVFLARHDDADESEFVSGNLAWWRARCRREPHNYPFCVARDLVLLSRPDTRELSDAEQLGSWIGVDKSVDVSTVTDSKAACLRNIAEAKRSAYIAAAARAQAGGAA